MSEMGWMGWMGKEGSTRVPISINCVYKVPSTKLQSYQVTPGGIGNYRQYILDMVGMYGYP